MPALPENARVKLEFKLRCTQMIKKPIVFGLTLLHLLTPRLSFQRALETVVPAVSNTQHSSSDHTGESIQAPTAPVTHEYLWYEAEDMRGFSTGLFGAPVSNPSWLNLPRAKAPGWGMNGPGVSAEWSQGGESGWNSAAASADETRATIYQDLEIPRAGDYRVWVRYADWANKDECFTMRILQQLKIAERGNRGTGEQGKSRIESSGHEFGAKDVVDAHDEVSMYWGWAFTWDSAAGKLEKGPARLFIEIERSAAARRHVDCILVTNDLSFVPDGRRKPDFAATRYLEAWSRKRDALTSLITPPDKDVVPQSWLRPKIAGRDFFTPWNIANQFWQLYEQPASKRPLFPFNAEPIEEFVKQFAGAPDVPIFSSQLVVPVIHLNNLRDYLKEGSPFLRYLRDTHSPFAILINYGSANLSEDEGQAAWRLLNGELKNQFLGWISGESVGYIWDAAPSELKITPSMSRRELLEAHQVFYTNQLTKKWGAIFHTGTGPLWDKLIPAQSTSSTSFAHALSSWGVRLLGIETAAVQPLFAMRVAFTRGAARQFGGAFLYYHAPNFGDTATTFTKAQNFAGPDNFFHSRYGATMGPSLSWYRKCYYFYYMAGASAIYLEQGFDQFFKPGPGDHPFQLNPLGKITDEFMRFAEKHPDRGVPYTPIAFLLDPAHGWDMTDYPQWPFEVSQISRGDRALSELFGVAYYPGPVRTGEPATADRQAFVSGIFGDVFDVLVADEGPVSGSNYNPLTNYRAVVVGGRIDWTPRWIQKLTEYAQAGGTIVLNAAQMKGLPQDLVGLRQTNSTAETNTAHCLSPGEPPQDLTGQTFRYERVQLREAKPLIAAVSGDALVTINRVGKGRVIFSALPDLLGEDERITPFAAHMLTHIFAGALPIEVRGDVEYLLNRTASGWLVTIFNNNGVYKPQQGLARVDHSAVVVATVNAPTTIHRATDWTSGRTLEVQRLNGQSSMRLSLAPGAVAIVALE